MDSHRASSGLIHLTRIQSIRSSDPNNYRVNSSLIESSKNSDDQGSEDDQSWSWMYLKSEFNRKNSEKLFRKYQARLQHNFFMVLLILNIVFNVIAIVFSLSDEVRKTIFSLFFPTPLIRQTVAIRRE